MRSIRRMPHIQRSLRPVSLLGTAAFFAFSTLSACIAPNHHMDRTEEYELYPSNMAGLEYRIGVSEFHEAGWDPINHPITTGFLYRSYLELEPLELEVGGSFAYDKHVGGSVTLERLRLYETNLGLAISKPLGPRRVALVEPYAGAGVALVFGRYDADLGGGLDHFEDAGTGYYLHAGVRFYVQRRQYLAFDWRWLGGVELDLDNGRVNADQQTLSIVFGYSF